MKVEKNVKTGCFIGAAFAFIAGAVAVVVGTLSGKKKSIESEECEDAQYEELPNEETSSETEE